MGLTAIGRTDSNGNPDPLSAIRGHTSGFASPTGNMSVNGWESDGYNGWRWVGDPSIHRVGEVQSQRFDPHTGANYNSSLADAYAAAAATQSSQDSAQGMLRSQTNRTLELLRQQVGQGSQQGIGHLRQNLAQRGMLDSGSLGAGVTSIANQGNQTLATGTMHAANNETDQLMRLLENERSRQFAAQQQQNQLSAQRQMAQQQQDYEQANKPKWYEYLLGGLGQAAGTAGGYALGQRLAR